jgi:hypothetical protein
MLNVYKNQQNRQTGSRNLMGPKTLPTIWGTYMKLVTKYQISAINSCWENVTKNVHICSMRFLLPVCQFCLFLYTFNIHLYMHIFRRIFLSNYWWQESDIWSQASYRYAILWKNFSVILVMNLINHFWYQIDVEEQYKDGHQWGRLLLLFSVNLPVVLNFLAWHDKHNIHTIYIPYLGFYNAQD